MGTVTENKFFSRDRQKAFDEIKDIMYARMNECENTIESEYYADEWERGCNAAIKSEIRFIRSVIDMMERS